MGCGGSTDGARMNKHDSKASMKVRQLLIDHNVEKDPKVSYNYNLSLDCKRKNHMEFVEEWKSTQFPTIKSVAILKVASITSKDAQALDRFLEGSLSTSMKHFYLSSGHSSSYPDIQSFETGLSSFLGAVEDEVFFEGLSITSSQLQNIIQAAHKVKNLTFFNCKIDIDDTFHVDKNLKFKIETLDLCCSYYPKSSKFMDKQKFEKFSKAWGMSHLKQSLRVVHITSYKKEEKTEPGNEEKQILDKYGFNNADLHCDKDWPIPSSQSQVSNRKSSHW